MVCTRPRTHLQLTATTQCPGEALEEAQGVRKTPARTIKIGLEDKDQAKQLPRKPLRLGHGDGGTGAWGPFPSLRASANPPCFCITYKGHSAPVPASGHPLCPHKGLCLLDRHCAQKYGPSTGKGLEPRTHLRPHSSADSLAAKGLTWQGSSCPLLTSQASCGFSWMPPQPRAGTSCQSTVPLLPTLCAAEQAPEGEVATSSPRDALRGQKP